MGGAAPPEVEPRRDDAAAGAEEPLLPHVTKLNVVLVKFKNVTFISGSWAQFVVGGAYVK